MTNRKNTSRALVASALAVLLCVSMLVGSTFAWFTDNATTSVNKIESGTLKIELQDKDGKPLGNTPLGFVKAEDGALIDNNAILWEPGCSYLLQPAKVVNKGNLWVKYQVTISGYTAPAGEADLAEVIDVFEDDTKIGTLNEVITNGVLVAESKLAPFGKEGSSAEFGQLKLVMQTTAGNEYQGKTINGVTITVLATQAAVEYDSYNNEYDATAEYPQFIENVPELDAALTAQQSDTLILNNDITLGEKIEIVGEKVLNLNGKTMTVTEDRALTVGNGASLTLTNGTVEYAGEDTAIMVEGTSELTIDGATINVTNTITGSTYGNAMGIIVNQGTGSVVTMNSGEINVKGSNGGSGVYIAYAKGGNHTFNFNGGTINVETGKYGIGIECLSSNTLNLNGGTINMKDASEGWAFNVGQTSSDGSRQATVVTSAGATEVNLFGSANILCEDEDAAQFEGINLVVNNNN